MSNGKLGSVGHRAKKQDLLEAIERNPAYQLCPDYQLHIDEVNAAIADMKNQRSRRRP